MSKKMSTLHVDDATLDNTERFREDVPGKVLNGFHVSSCTSIIGTFGTGRYSKKIGVFTCVQRPHTHYTTIRNYTNYYSGKYTNYNHNHNHNYNALNQ